MQRHLPSLGSYSLFPFQGTSPQVHETAFIAPGAQVMGDVILHAHVGIWYNCVLRGDINTIEVGEQSNIQDGTVLHTATGPDFSLRIGARVTVGHGACVHACLVEDEVLVGIGSTILDGAIIRSHSIVAAGALVPPRMEVPSGVLVAGVPAKILRDLKESEIENLAPHAERYVQHAREHREAIQAAMP